MTEGYGSGGTGVCPVAGDGSREWRPMAEFEALRREWAAAMGDAP